MRGVTREITREILAPAISALMVATFLMLTTQILRVGEAVFGYGLGLVDFAGILSLLLPRFLVFALPLSVVVGVLAGLGRMNTDRELLAWRAAGLSPAALWPAPVLVGIVASSITLGLTTFGEPAALHGLTKKLSTVVELNLATGLEPGVIHQEIPGVVLHAADQGEDGALEAVFLHMELEAGTATVAAKRARLQGTGGEGLHLSLQDGEMVRTSRRGMDDAAEPVAAEPRMERLRFESAAIDLDVAEAVGRRSRFIGSLDGLTITELADYMREHSSAWERQRARAAFHRRLAMGSSCLFLSFLGLGMALFFGKPGASGRGAGFAGGIVALFTFYILLRVTENLAVSGAGPAGVLLWAPNAAAGLIGAVFLFMAVRR